MGSTTGAKKGPFNKKINKMGKLKDLLISIEEKESDKEFLCSKLGIGESELNQLDFVIEPGSDELFSRSIIFNLKNSPKDVLDKIAGLKNGNTFNYVFDNFSDDGF